METIVGRLRDAWVVKGEIVACDATFIKAFSKRDKRMIRGATAIQTLGRAEKGYRLQAPLSCGRRFRPSIGGYSCTGKPEREDQPKLSSYA
jgi:hypothetical protein